MRTAATTAATATATPVRTTGRVPIPSIVRPPSTDPQAIPALAAEAGRDDASAAPGPASVTTRSWTDGVMPKAIRPQTTSAGRTRSALDATAQRTRSAPASPQVPTTSVRAAHPSASRPPPTDPARVAAP